MTKNQTRRWAAIVVMVLIALVCHASALGLRDRLNADRALGPKRDQLLVHHANQRYIMPLPSMPPAPPKLGDYVVEPPPPPPAVAAAAASATIAAAAAAAGVLTPLTILQTLAAGKPLPAMVVGVIMQTVPAGMISVRVVSPNGDAILTPTSQAAANAAAQLIANIPPAKVAYLPVGASPVPINGVLTPATVLQTLSSGKPLPGPVVAAILKALPAGMVNVQVVSATGDAILTPTSQDAANKAAQVIANLAPASVAYPPAPVPTPAQIAQVASAALAAAEAAKNAATAIPKTPEAAAAVAAANAALNAPAPAVDPLTLAAIAAFNPPKTSPLVDAIKGQWETIRPAIINAASNSNDPALRDLAQRAYNDAVAKGLIQPPPPQPAPVPTPAQPVPQTQPVPAPVPAPTPAPVPAPVQPVPAPATPPIPAAPTPAPAPSGPCRDPATGRFKVCAPGETPLVFNRRGRGKLGPGALQPATQPGVPQGAPTPAPQPPAGTPASRGGLRGWFGGLVNKAKAKVGQLWNKAKTKVSGWLNRK